MVTKPKKPRSITIKGKKYQITFIAPHEARRYMNKGYFVSCNMEDLLGGTGAFKDKSKYRFSNKNFTDDAEELEWYLDDDWEGTYPAIKCPPISKVESINVGVEELFYCNDKFFTHAGPITRAEALKIFNFLGRRLGYNTNKEIKS